MNFCKQLMWTLPLSAGGILLGMTRNSQAIIGGLVLCIAVSIKWRMLMQEQQENFLRSLKAQGNSLQGIFEYYLIYINKTKTDEISQLKQRIEKLEQSLQDR